MSTDDGRDDDDSPPYSSGEIRTHYTVYPPGTPITREASMSRDFAGPEGLPLREFENEIDALRRDHEHTQRDVTSLLGSRAAMRKILWLVIPALAGGLVTALIYAGDKIAMSAERVGRTEARLDAIEKRLDDRGAEISQLRVTMEHEIDQLRAALLKITGTDTKPITIVRTP
jgi:hypothetical protein